MTSILLSKLLFTCLNDASAIVWVIVPYPKMFCLSCRPNAFEYQLHERPHYHQQAAILFACDRPCIIVESKLRTNCEPLTFPTEKGWDISSTSNYWLRAETVAELEKLWSELPTHHLVLRIIEKTTSVKTPCPRIRGGNLSTELHTFWFAESPVEGATKYLKAFFGFT